MLKDIKAYVPITTVLRQVKDWDPERAVVTVEITFFSLWRAHVYGYKAIIQLSHAPLPFDHILVVNFTIQ